MRRILEVARLVRVLEDSGISKEDKLNQIKMVQSNGDITVLEAIDLVIEYFTWAEG